MFVFFMKNVLIIFLLGIGIKVNIECNVLFWFKLIIWVKEGGY